MTLLESIEYVSRNKSLAAVSARKLGTVTFEECRELIHVNRIDNRSNRDEDLDSILKYYGKLHHLIRYVSGISEKGQLLISVLKDTDSTVGFIRDNGTMFSLTFGGYYSEKVLTGNRWLDLCDDIIDTYDINNDDDKYVINLIRSFFNSKKNEQLSYEYSLKDVVSSSKEFQDFYDKSKIGFVVSLHTVKQFEKDMINCNRQTNAWLAYNFYMTPQKRLDAYRSHFCGDKLIEFFDGKLGADTFEPGKLLYGHQKYTEKHKVGRMIPILQTIVGSEYCDTIDDFKEFHEMVVRFERGSDEGKEIGYWSDAFKRLITEFGYSHIIEWYEKKYKSAFELDEWDNITREINSIVNLELGGSKPQSITDLHIKKYHTGILMISIVLFFKRKYPKVGLKTITTKVVDEYVRLLGGDVNHNNESIPVWKYFGTHRDVYKSTNADSRWEKIFKYVLENVQSDFENRSIDRDRQSEYRTGVLNRVSSFFENEGMNSRLKLFPLSTDNITTINFKNGDGLHWLHKTPHSSGGNAKDGFLGMVDDNLDSSTKYKNWDCTPNEYWLMVAERNEKMLDSLEGTTKRLVERSINSIYQVIDTLDLSA